jgi:long-chain acyl-CoA synthetase
MQGFVPPPRILLETSRRLGAHPAYHVRGEQGWISTSWQTYGDEVRQAARALIDLGVQRGDAVAILGFNSPQWATMAFAAMSIGATPAGIYWTSSSQDIAYILNHCKASVLLVDDTRRLANVEAVEAELLHLSHIVMLSPTAHHQSSPLITPTGRRKLMSWDAFLKLGASVPERQLDERLKGLSPDDIGTLIYTSGTTGPAKAVALSQGNLWWMGQNMTSLYEVNERDRMLSYLPLAHIAEQMGSMHNQAHAGLSVYYARSIEELGDHLKEVRPTIFFGEPRVWEKMQAGIEAKLKEATGLKASLARWALDVGQRWHELDHAGRPQGPWLGLQMALARRLIHRKVQAALGFDQARFLSSGAAPIHPDKLRFFAGLDLPVRELYGQSEVCGPSTMSFPGSTRVGSVGKALPGTEIRVADDGELLVRGPHLFQGYMGSPGATADSFEDGWLRTGDIGYIDEDGFVYITGRKKDIIITSGGKNIAPANIEAGLMEAELIEHAVVCGDNRHYLTALLTLDPLALKAFSVSEGLPAELRLHDHPRVLAALQQAVDQVNATQARVAHVRKFAVLPRSLSIEGGELTPTLKVKRKVVIDRNASLIDELYRQDS